MRGICKLPWHWLKSKWSAKSRCKVTNEHGCGSSMVESLVNDFLWFTQRCSSVKFSWQQMRSLGTNEYCIRIFSEILCQKSFLKKFHGIKKHPFKWFKWPFKDPWHPLYRIYGSFPRYCWRFVASESPNLSFSKCHDTVADRRRQCCTWWKVGPPAICSKIRSLGWGFLLCHTWINYIWFLLYLLCHKWIIFWKNRDFRRSYDKLISPQLLCHCFSIAGCFPVFCSWPSKVQIVQKCKDFPWPTSDLIRCFFCWKLGSLLRWKLWKILRSEERGSLCWLVAIEGFETWRWNICSLSYTTEFSRSKIWYLYYLHMLFLSDWVIHTFIMFVQYC